MIDLVTILNKVYTSQVIIISQKCDKKYSAFKDYTKWGEKFLKKMHWKENCKINTLVM